MILRPAACVIHGELVRGLEVYYSNGVIQDVLPLSGPAEDWILSPAFVNAHSHLEYRGLLGKVKGDDFVSWIRAITLAKAEQHDQDVVNDCLLAGRENKATGVAWLGEHSDRPYSRVGMTASGLQGPIFQELITFNEHENPQAKLEKVERRAVLQQAVISPHAPYTIDRPTLEWLSGQPLRLSIHAAESEDEREFFLHGTGRFAEMYERFDVPKPATGLSPIAYLAQAGFLRPYRQLVHCCAVDDDDLDLMARTKVSVAHCPRSNAALGCPKAPIEKMLERGINVGIGMDSCASSGEIDMFAEMRAVDLPAKTVWNMATTMGAETHGLIHWNIQRWVVPLIRLNLPDANSVEDLIEKGSPECVEWITDPA